MQGHRNAYKISKEKACLKLPYEMGLNIFDDFKINQCEGPHQCSPEELGWDGLTASQWKQLHAIEDLLQPFAHQTNNKL